MIVTSTFCAGETYLKLLEAAKAGAPDIHVHAFSPLEVHHQPSNLHSLPRSTVQYAVESVVSSLRHQILMLSTSPLGQLSGGQLRGHHIICLCSRICLGSQ